MKIADIIDEYYDAFLTRYEDRLLPGHLKALNAMRYCRSAESGELFVQCPNCDHRQRRPLSCGHRSCPQCRNHEASRWIDRQQDKLLPVSYFMVTFTLPCELRALAYRHQKTMYALFFSCVSDTLKDFGMNPRHLGADIGMTMVLHTHTRKLDYHPHLHVVVVPAVGKGITAIQYLSRYLYRGVVSERNILSSRNGCVTFRYTESKTGNTCYRTLKGEEFLYLVIRHVLPGGFRRVRDYGFLHSNAKKLLLLVQLVLHVRTRNTEQRPRPSFKCPCCKSPMQVLFFRIDPG